MRNLSFVLVLVFFTACDSGAPGSDDQQPPRGGGGGGGGSGGGGGGGNPTPTPAVVLDDAAIELRAPGGFPSDIVLDGSGRLVTVADAQIPANLVLYRTDFISATPETTIAIGANHLIDHDGVRPARAPTSFGNGLFGAFVGDLEIAFDRWLLVTVGAGNSISDDGNSPLRLANLVVIDLQTAQVVQTLNLAWMTPISGQFSGGGPYTNLPQSLPAMVAFLPSRNSTQTGRIFVAMSNGAGSTQGLQTFFNGTVQSWRADFTRSQPISVDTTGKAPLDVTRTYVTRNYNPVGVSRYANASGHSTLILTTAGASRFDANFVAQPTTTAVLEFLDLDADRWRDDWAVDLGRVLPSVHKLILSEDAGGLKYGAFTSQTFAAAYFVELTGLESNPVDPARLRLLRSVDLAPGGAATAGSGFQPGIAISPGGRTLLLTEFNSGTLTVVGLPDDIEFGPLVVNPAPFEAALLGPARSSLGAIVAPRNAAAAAFFVVNGTFDGSFSPSGSSFLGTLTVTGGLP